MHLVSEVWRKAGVRPPAGARPCHRLHAWVARAHRQCKRSAVGTQQLLSSSLEPQDCMQAFQPSPHLRELVSQQLRFLFTTGSFQTGLAGARATVYARCSSLLPGPDLQLQRVASWPPRASRPAWMSSSSLSAGPQDLLSTMEEDDLLLLASNAWGSPGEGGTHSAEASLLGEEVLLLPNSATLVLPLASQGVLVGLLVVEGTAPTPPAAAGGLVPLPQQPPGGPPLGPVSLLSSFDGSVWDEDLPLTPSNTSEPGPASTTPSVAAACVGLTEQQLDVLRAAVPMLAAAAALDMRSALAGAAAAASAAKAASLLSEARGPLLAISTFGRMLVPRLEEGEPDRDMAAGIATQEVRLREVLGALEAALRPSSSSWAGQGMPAGLGGGGAATFSQQQQQQQQQQWQQLAPGWGTGQPSWEGSSLSGSAWPALDGAGDTWAMPPGDWLPLLEQQQQQQQLEGMQAAVAPPVDPEGQLQAAAAGAAVTAAAAAAGEEAASDAGVVLADVPAAAGAAGEAMPAAPDAVWGPELPAAIRASVRDIRWSPGSRRRGADVPLTQPRSSSSVAAATMGVTLDVTTSTTSDSSHAPGDTGVSSSSSSSSSSGGGQPQPAAGGVLGPGDDTPADKQRGTTSLSSSSVSGNSSSEGECCDLGEVVQHVLRAAAKLATVQGVHLIVNHPLQAPDTEQHAHHSRTQPGTLAQAGEQAEASSEGDGSLSLSTSSSEEEEQVAPDSVPPAQANSSSTSSSSGEQQEGDPSLAPHPPPPLWVAARPQVVQRSLGYVLDVALQCTPAGGQLVVTARQCSSGVELCVLHTGQLHPRRLHPSSRAMAAALPGPGGEVGGVGQGEQLGSSRLAGRVDGLVSLTFAQQLLQGVGGRINVVHPHHFMNASSGQLEVGTSVEVWLPRASSPSTCGSSH